MDHRETIAAVTPKATRKAFDQCEENLLFSKLTDDERKKPPLKPPSRRTYYTRSVCTKSTASTTYLSSDSEEEDDDNTQQDYTCSDDGSFFVTKNNRPRRSNDSKRPARITRSQSERCLSSKSKLNYITAATAPVSSKEWRTRNSMQRTDLVEYTNQQEEDVYNLTSDDDDDSSVEGYSDDEHDFPDLDTLISESSTRWKSDVQTTVSKSSTAAFLQKSNVFPSALRSNVPPSSSSPQTLRLYRSVSDSTSSALVVSTKSTRRVCSTTATTKLIQEQHQEIARLKALLQPKQAPCSDIVLSGSTPNRSPESCKAGIAYARTPGRIGYLDYQRLSSLPVASADLVSCGYKSTINRNRVGTQGIAGTPEKLTPRNSLHNAPFDHIEVRINEDNDDMNSTCWNDDLTVGSSFNALVTVADKRPDADQDQHDSPSSLKLTNAMR